MSKRETMQQALYDALCHWGTLPEPEGDVPERYHRWEDLGGIADKLIAAVDRDAGKETEDTVRVPTGAWERVNAGGRDPRDLWALVQALVNSLDKNSS